MYKCYSILEKYIPYIPDMNLRLNAQILAFRYVFIASAIPNFIISFNLYIRNEKKKNYVKNQC